MDETHEWVNLSILPADGWPPTRICTLHKQQPIIEFTDSLNCNSSLYEKCADTGQPMDGAH